MHDRDCGDENDCVVSRPHYCPRCCEDAEMNEAPDHFAFICPKGHLIPAIWYVMK